MPTLYALLTTNCNLSCPYCDVKKCDEVFNRDLFISQMNKFDGRIVLFGGEPTMYPDRLIDIYIDNPLLTRKISSISTNLIKIDNRVLTILQFIGSISTSWNPNRFNEDQYDRWLCNLREIDSNIPSVRIRILITMVPDILRMTPHEFNEIISKWNFNVIKDIRFEHYIGNDTSPEYFNKCDEWLCKIYESWNSPIRMSNIDIVNNWYFDCTDVWTLKPDGLLIKGCPHNMDIHVPEKCYTCDKSDICKPCQLQRYCSYPSKFIELVKSNKKED